MPVADAAMPTDIDQRQIRDPQLAAEVERRRSFAIISHPDAGKTTLTEKLLLYSGMIRTAGVVGARKKNKAAASDWMGMEQERGISITASAMQFEYKGRVVNILDTPGHQDFCEDTYRTLTAADSVIMVIDAAKGVETQTRKLFDACRLRAIPVLTFINKMDLPGRDPIDLMDEVEEVLGIHAAASNWPVGRGREFRGVADHVTREVQLYERTATHGSTMPPVTRLPVDSDEARDRLGAEARDELASELDLLAAAGNPFDREAFLAGAVTPVYFGSALTNFGVEPLFDAFIELAPPPGIRRAVSAEGAEVEIDPRDDVFSAYVFKLQANMNPRHRDCVAFLRIVSGRFEKDMSVHHVRLGRKVRLSRPHSLLAAERGTIEQAFPGDVIGVINPGIFSIGDTILGGRIGASRNGGDGDIAFPPLPQFQPEVFARLRPADHGKRKAIDRGLEQLAAEGAVQVLREVSSSSSFPLVAAVGRLQFDVLQYRLKDEYGVQTDLVPLPYQVSAWIRGDLAAFRKPTGALLVHDAQNRPLVLFSDPWEKRLAITNNPDHELLDHV